MNTNARRRGAKVAPSYYPRIAFHGLRCAQLISATIVGGVMAYFMYYLRKSLILDLADDKISKRFINDPH